MMTVLVLALLGLAVAGTAGLLFWAAFTFDSVIPKD
jgi:hypothetical protein